MAIEEPAFTLVDKADNIEVRQYQAVIVAETIVEGDLSTASNEGFRRIADFIFGNNRAAGGAASQKIAMTSPVVAEPVAASAKIAMTAPVGAEPLGGAGTMLAKSWRIQFTMPSNYTMSTLPQPNNAAVKIREIPGKRVAALVFSGFAGEEKSQEKTAELLAWLKAKGIVTLSSPQLARYNPPWTLPFFRRNEILVDIAGP